MAMSRMKALERKLANDPELRSKVHQQITEYLAKGYAHKATKEELADMTDGNVWYVPLNVVLNPRKPGKVRLVWDARATVNGISLNTELLTGPDFLVPLQSVMSGFREKRDIQEMYHQFRIRAADKKVPILSLSGRSKRFPRNIYYGCGYIWSNMFSLLCPIHKKFECVSVHARVSGSFSGSD